MSKQGYFLYPVSFGVAVCLSVFACACSTVDSSGLVAPNPALEEEILADHFSAQEDDFFKKLNHLNQEKFLDFSPLQRAQAMFFAKKQTPEVAVATSLVQDMHRLPDDQQALFAKLNKQNQVLFLSLDEEWTDWVVVQVRDGMDADAAVERGIARQREGLTDEEEEFIKHLSAPAQLLFCALGYEAQNKALIFAQKMQPDDAVERAAQIDINRLPKEQKDFCSLLSTEQKAIYLLLTPQARGFAIALTKPMEPNLAVEYTSSLTATAS